MKTFQYLPLETKDIELFLVMRAELYAHDSEPYPAEAARVAVVTFLAHPEWGRIYSIYAEAEMAGYLVLTWCASLEFGGRFALLDELFVAEAWRGHGAGSGALEFATDVCRGEDVTALRLEVDRSNPGARELYRRTGFVAHDRDLMTLRLQAVDRSPTR